ncbi:MAG: phenylalanine--tRNA ligase subunit beta [Calditrichaeota bacterium]|nr:MAG: phenylalanine--tRNA ligase subunit beta [Calditrichota bacterium]
MKITRNWINDLSGLNLSDEQIDDKLTMLGLEVEEAIPTVPDLKGVVVGKVLQAYSVENSDHLSCCQVDIGSEELQIICGAPNVAAGQKVPVATVGAVLPGGFKIKKAKLRGLQSSGMICSEKELAISSEAEGIMVLPETAQIGQPINDLLDESDTIFDVFITPNRPDCLGAIGIARELCISENKVFQTPVKETPEENSSAETPLSIEIHNEISCPRYTGIVIKGIKVGPSPQWLVTRLEHLGLRSISNIVDITNYVMYETGQPLHAFDYDKIAGATIKVRNAVAGEKFTTLDEQERNLNENDLLICDDEKPVAIAGVMGGLDSEVTNQTTNVLLEVAYFDATTIRATSSRLGLSTDASKRFERGIDPNNTAKVSQRAIKLILELAGGQLSSEFVDVYPKTITPVSIQLRSSHIAKIIGREFNSETVRNYLEALECQVSQEGMNFTVQPPTFRPDLTREIDLIEEITRLFGYNEIEDSLQNTIGVLGHKNAYIDFVEKVKIMLTSLGISEAITVSMTSAKQSAPFIENETDVARIVNPLSEEMSILRPAIASTLLGSVAYNLNRKNSNVRLFEIGSSFIQGKKEINETVQLGGVLTGHVQPKSWLNQVPESFSIFTVKGMLQFLFSELNINNLKYSAEHPKWYSYGITLQHKKENIGHFGLLSQKTLKEYDILQDVFYFELDLKYLYSLYNAGKVFQDISKFPAIDRDIALLVDKNISAGDILSAIENTAGKLLKKVLLFDIYEGERIDKNKKSLAYSLEFQSPTRTLEENEVTDVMYKILKLLKSRFNAELRD